MSKIRAVLCAIFGHSNIVTGFFGYIYCGRCEAQIGDTLASVWRNDKAVVIGHDCEICNANRRRLRLVDRLLIKAKS
jgi:hypothetical protein